MLLIPFGKKTMSTQFEPEPTPKWIRKDFDEAAVQNLNQREKVDRRKIAEIETARDLVKPIEQLVSDAHEEALDIARSGDENIAGAQKRMVSLMARVALSNDEVAKRMVWLTWVIVALTAVILVFTILMWDQNRT